MQPSFFLALASVCIASPLAPKPTQSGAYFVDCTMNKTGKKSSQMWILKDVNRPDFTKAAVAVTSRTQFLDFQKDTNFGEMQMFFGSDPAGPVGVLPNGMFKVSYQSDGKPYLEKDTNDGILATPLNFLTSTFLQDTLPGQRCSGFAWADFPIDDLEIKLP